MRRFLHRRRPIHFEKVEGALFITWRLHPDQPPLRPEEREAVLDVIKRDDGVVGQLLAVVVMDDHVHALARPVEGVTIQRIAQTWKSVSSHAMTREHGRIAPVWQRSYWDRSLISESRIRRCVDYIIGNPGRRWPGIEEYPWAYHHRE